MRGSGLLDEAVVMQALEAVKDPEIPVVSVVELGIVQAVQVDSASGAVVVSITPTFSGCPALDLMRTAIESCVLDLGASAVRVEVVLDPPWTSDRIAPEARARMQAIGLAPPPPVGRFRTDISLTLEPLLASEDPVPCPYCGSSQTVMENGFGPTICRSAHYCNGCLQSFEAFKAL